MDYVVWDRSIKLFPHRTLPAQEILAELRALVDRGSADIRFQGPAADVQALLAGVAPPEIQVIVGTLRPERKTDPSIWNGCSAAVFRDVEISRLYGMLMLNTDYDGASYSDYVTFGTRATAVHSPKIILPAAD